MKIRLLSAYTDSFQPFNIQPFLLIIGFILLLLVVLFCLLYLRSRKENLEKYNHRNKWRHQVLKSIPDMVVIFDTKPCIVEIFNPLENVLLGLKPKEIIGMPMRDIGNLKPAFSSAANRIADCVEKTVATQKTHTLEYDVKTDGRTNYAVCHISPLMDNQVICYVHDNTYYIEAEKKSTELKSFFQSIIDNIPVGILVKNVSNELRYVFFNNHLLDFHGNENPFQLGQNDYDRWEPMTEEFVKEDLMVIDSDKPISFERVTYDEETGQPTRWSITTKNSFTGADGTPYLMATSVETTESKKKDFELIKMQRELTLALEAGKVSAWYYDIKNNYFSSLNGKSLTKNKLTMAKFLSIIHPDDGALFQQLITALASGKKEKGKIIVRVVKNDKTEWFESHVIAMKSEKNGEVYQIIGTERNITEDVMKQKELQDTHSKLEMAFASAQMIAWEIDNKTSRFSSINSDVIEYSNPDIDLYKSFLHPDDIRIWDEGFESIINGKKKLMTIQVRMTFPNESLKWFEYHALISERDENGHVARIVGLRRDITALKMTDELIELREKAEHANRLKSAFLANMSHEIRTPLNAIVGFSQLIMQTDDREEQDNYAQIIETNNELLLQLISDILDLSKIEAGEMDFIYSEFDVVTIFHQLEHIYTIKTKDGVALNTVLPKRPCKIFSERNRITQVISNFLNNACKFTFAGTITMGYEYVEGGLRFYVKDTGKGIAQENIPNVFARFSKFDSFVQGTGLGLSISKFIVEYLEGEIGAESELGKGSEFWFTIPCEPIFT